MNMAEIAELKNPETVKAVRDNARKLVLDGKMSVEDYLMKVCGVPRDMVPAMRSVAGF